MLHSVQSIIVAKKLAVLPDGTTIVDASCGDPVLPCCETSPSVGRYPRDYGRPGRLRRLVGMSVEKKIVATSPAILGSVVCVTDPGNCCLVEYPSSSSYGYNTNNSVTVEKTQLFLAECSAISPETCQADPVGCCEGAIGSSSSSAGEDPDYDPWLGTPCTQCDPDDQVPSSYTFDMSGWVNSPTGLDGYGEGVPCPTTPETYNVGLVTLRRVGPCQFQWTNGTITLDLYIADGVEHPYEGYMTLYDANYFCSFTWGLGEDFTCCLGGTTFPASTISGMFGVGAVVPYGNLTPLNYGNCRIETDCYLPGLPRTLHVTFTISDAGCEPGLERWDGVTYTLTYSDVSSWWSGEFPMISPEIDYGGYFLFSCFVIGDIATWQLLIAFYGSGTEGVTLISEAYDPLELTFENTSWSCGGTTTLTAIITE